ncbi:hypothetical protein AGOR_G00075980 [Albula goreensis]|uniref:Uncharacterized protein n=1 Tax=Albula goreensis TaxID=1534307 RepID=A0A8T3DMT3_9TELE|nr:hypothetical protein AGOR_G00075980 [Albula goreensis]
MEAVASNDQPPIHIPGNEDGPLVAVTFQKNPQHIRKYLEAEPKALGLTQITLSVYQVSMGLASIATGFGSVPSSTVQVVASLFVIMAGIAAIAAQNLQMAALRTCLGMEVVASVASAINFFASTIQISDHPRLMCYSSFNATEPSSMCRKLGDGIEHYHAEEIVLHVALFAISVTLAVYCCKVIHCCTPMSSTPVITINAPPSQR